MGFARGSRSGIAIRAAFAKGPAKSSAKSDAGVSIRLGRISGVIEIGGVAWVSLYDTKSKKSYRLSQDVDGEDGFQLVRYDRGSKPGEETIVVRQNGLTRNLSLKDADIIALAEAPQRAPQRTPQRATQRANPTTATPVRQPSNPNIEAASDEEVRERHAACGRGDPSSTRS